MAAVPDEIFRSLVDASQDFIGTIDRDGSFVYLNPAGRRMLEIPLDEDIVGQSIVPYNDIPSKEITEAAHAILDQGTVMGVSIFITRSGTRLAVSQSFIVHETDLGKHYSTIARDISDRLELEKSLRERADRDPLTGLLNRTAFRQLATGSATEHVRHLAILDLDGFKSVNDTHGHHVGDNLLKRVSEALETAFNDETLLARFGGDEFVILADDDRVEAKVDLVLRTLLEPFGAGVSIGLAHYNESVDFEVAMRTADERLYASKRLKRTSVAIGSPFQ